MTKVAPPLTERQAARIEPLGLFADDPVGLLAALTKVEELWADAVAQARRLPEAELETRVTGEWSFIETLRHLINVTDAWIGDVVLQAPSPYDPIGLPPDFFTPGEELGLDLAARPSLTHTLRVRNDRMTIVRETLGRTTEHALDQHCAGWAAEFTILGAFQNVIFEEWAHHYYATRDLTMLGAATDDA